MSVFCFCRIILLVLLLQFVSRLFFFLDIPDSVHFD